MIEAKNRTTGKTIKALEIKDTYITLFGQRALTLELKPDHDYAIIEDEYEIVEC